MSPGRNDRCHCGSGRKYKKCCLAADEARRAASTTHGSITAPTEDAANDDDTDDNDGFTNICSIPAQTWRRAMHRADPDAAVTRILACAVETRDGEQVLRLAEELASECTEDLSDDDLSDDDLSDDDLSDDDLSDEDADDENFENESD